MTSIRDALREDHRQLDALFEDLLNRTHADDPAAVGEAWTAFEHGLLTHLEAEEKHMIPLFELHDPIEAANLLAEHERLRSLLAELGVMLDIHTLREDKVEALIAFLRAHAAREEAALYRWADVDLPAAPKASILDWIRAAQRAAPDRAMELASDLGSMVI